MPIYEYQCEDCGEIFEVITNSNQESASCPACIGGSDDKPGIGRRIMSAGFFQVKGYNSLNRYSKEPHRGHQ